MYTAVSGSSGPLVHKKPKIDLRLSVLLRGYYESTFFLENIS